MFYSLDGFWLILIIILLVVLFSKVSGLKARLSRLESLYGKEKLPPAASAPSVGFPQAAGSVASPQVNQVVPNIPNVPSSGDRFTEWLKEDWLLKLGGFLLLIGFGWFTTYAFMNNWIGPAGRITLGILAGIIVLVFGTFRIKKYINQGGVFLVLGSTIIILTVFAARGMYDMFTPVIALILIFLSAAYISLVSVKYNSFAVSFSGLILSLIAPLLTNSPKGGEIYFFSYLVIVVLGAIWIVVIRKNWGALIFASLIGVFLYSLPVILDVNHYKDALTLLNFAYLFAFIFFISSIVNIIKSKEEDIKSFLWVAVLNGIFLLSWIMAVVPKEWQSLMIVLWMIAFAVGAFLLFAKTKIRNVFYVYAAISVVMLATATAIQLDGAALTLAYIIESALIPILIYLTTKDLKASSVSSLLLIGPILLSLGNLQNYMQSGTVFTSDFFVLLLLAIVLMGLGLMYKKFKSGGEVLSFNSDNTLLILGSVYIYGLIWTAFHVAMNTDQAIATTICLIIFTIIGLVKYFYGISVGSKILRNYGGVFLGLVVFRLIFIDVWSMEMGARIVVFFLVGILLVSTAFISRRIKNHEI